MNSNGSTLKDESFSDARSSLCARLGTGTSDSLFTDELMKALRERPTRRFINLYTSDPNDTQQIDAGTLDWTIISSGKKYHLNFSELGKNSAALSYSINREYSAKPLRDEELGRLGQFLHWATSHLLSSYSAGYTYELFYTHKTFFSGLESFTAKSCIERLFNFENRPGYFPWKRIIGLCCEFSLPGFSVDDLIDLESMAPPFTRDLWQSYYDLEIKLKPAVLRFLEMGIGRDIGKIQSLTTEDLRGFSITILCLESGMRPAQLFKLKEEDFKNRHNRYFSISIPPAKQAKRVDKAPFELDLSPEAGTIIQALIDRCRPDLANGQLLRFPDGSLAMAKSFDKALNSRLRAWAARNFVGPMPETAELKDFLRHLPHLTAYDFRHHVGHSLAMSGASADQIARVLGHSSTVAARHYIAATPELAVIKQKALGENAAYQEMMGMILTGEIGEESDWRGRKVAGMVDNRLFTGIGGCSSSSCDFEPVRSCYGCSDFNPFLDGDHAGVRDALKTEAASQLAISDAAGQTHRSPAVLQLEGVIAEVQVVINHCKHRKGCQ